MQKSLFLTVFALIFFTGVSYSQEYTFGVKGGISIPNLSAGGTNTPLSEGYKSRIGTDFGIYLEKHFTKMFSLSVGLEYSEQGGKKTGLQALPSDPILTPINQAVGGALAQAQIANVTLPNPGYLYADYSNTAKLNYLLVPVLARLKWKLGVNSPFKFYVAAGPFAGFLVKAQQETGSGSTIYYDSNEQSLYNAYLQNLTSQQVPAPVAQGILSQIPFGQLAISAQKTNIKPDTHTFNFGFMGFIGFSYSYGSHSIFIEGGGNYGFLNIQKDASNGKNRIGAGVVTAGYAFSF